jgi:hypothetical protein
MKMLERQAHNAPTEIVYCPILWTLSAKLFHSGFPVLCYASTELLLF